MNIARDLVIAVAITAYACRNRAASSGEVPATSERIVQGVVSVTGTPSEQRLVLRMGSGQLRLHASPTDSAALVHVQRTEVSVRGENEGNALRVQRFTVTHAGNAPVADGIIQRDGDRLVLETVNRRFGLGNPPAEFWQLVGARVWVQGPLDTGPLVYGVIRQ